MDAKVISSVVEQIAQQLSAVGVPYEAASVAVLPATNSLPEGLGATMDGPTGRQLDVAVWEVANRLNFVISVRNTTLGKVVYVRDFLKFLKQEFSYDDFKFAATIDEAQAQDVAAKFVSVLTTNQKLIEVLRANEWLDVSFDWAGMR